MSAGGSARWQHGRAVDRAIAVSISVSIADGISVTDGNNLPDRIPVAKPDRRFNTTGEPLAHRITHTYRLAHDYPNGCSNSGRHACVRTTRGSAR